MVTLDSGKLNIASSSHVYNLPSLLPEQVLAMQPLTLFLVKLLLLTTTLLIGSLLVIILVVRAHNAKDISVHVKITGLDDEEKS